MTTIKEMNEHVKTKDIRRLQIIVTRITNNLKKEGFSNEEIRKYLREVVITICIIVT